MAALSFLFFVMLLPSSCKCFFRCEYPPWIFIERYVYLGEPPPWRCTVKQPKSFENIRFEWSQSRSDVAVDYEELDKQYFTKEGVEMVIRTLDFKRAIKLSDMGAVFDCIVYYSEGNCAATVMIDRYFVASNTPTITGPKKVTAGQSFTWTCYSEGATGSAPAIEWSFGGNQTVVPYKKYNYSETTVYKNPANNLTSFRLSCNVTIAITEGASGFSLTCTAIHLYSQRRIASTPYTINVKSSSEILALRQTTGTLPCKVDSAASVTKVRWFKDGKLLQTNSSRYAGSTTAKPSLTIWFMSERDTGKYTCKVTQGSKVTTSNTSLVVRYAPFMIYRHAQRAEGRLGSNVELKCVYSALPTPVGIYWFKVPVNRIQDEVFIDLQGKADKYSGSTPNNPHLTIKKVTKDDAGWYRCKADNEIGRGEGPVITLKVT